MDLGRLDRLVAVVPTKFKVADSRDLKNFIPVGLGLALEVLLGHMAEARLRDLLLSDLLLPDLLLLVGSHPKLV